MKIVKTADYIYVKGEFMLVFNKVVLSKIIYPFPYKVLTEAHKIDLNNYDLTSSVWLFYAKHTQLH